MAHFQHRRDFYFLCLVKSSLERERERERVNGLALQRVSRKRKQRKGTPALELGSSLLVYDP